MKISIVYEVNTAAEAKEIIEAVQRLAKLPYQLTGFGPPLVSGDIGALVELTELQEGSAHPNKDVEEVKTERPNVSPGEPSISKIGTQTKENLLFTLPHQPDAKWAEHMKLLWKRGEVKFDGTDYYR